MGLLKTGGKPLKWPDSVKYIEYIKKHGVEQFVNVYLSKKDELQTEFKFGDELEYLLVILPENEPNRAYLSLRSKEIQDKVTNRMKNDNSINNIDKIIAHPEYGSFMIEATPYIPYRGKGCDLLNIERNMVKRREYIEQYLNKNERLLTMSSYGMLGCGQQTIKKCQTNGNIANSEFICDEYINPHPRFATLTRNIRLRRGNKVDIHVPIYKDVYTPTYENDIYMDAMAFGMGCCCLQTTFNCTNINEARHLYDQLAVLTPIMMALTASTPILKGKISNLDARWTVISQSVDDRTPGERGKTALKSGEKRIYKSRYGTISNYLSNENWFKAEYNDIKVEIDEYTYKRLKDVGCDDLLSTHIAHLFIRDPLTIFSENIKVNDKETTVHFENIQSTNWQNVRFKPPNMNSNIGWRVEFRSMELQLTEFENAAFTVFITLVSRAILYYKINFYIPISKLDINFHRAHINNAVLNNKFYWRSCSSCNDGTTILKEKTIEEIMCGDWQCQGLIDIVKKYCIEMKFQDQTKKLVYQYLTFIQRKSRGDILTTAQWIRKFVYNHPEYKKDSNINNKINRDLIDVTQNIIKGNLNANDLIGKDIYIKDRHYYYNKINDDYCVESPTLKSKL